MRKLYPYIKPYLKYFIAAVLLTIGYSGFLSAAPMVEGFITTRLKDDIADIANNVPGASISFSYIIKILKLLLIIYIGNVLSNFGSQYFLTNGIQNTMRDLRNDVQKKISKLPISYFDTRTVGDILSIISNDIDTMSNALQQSLSRILSAFLSILLAAVLMFYINPVMGAVAVILIPGSALIMKIIMKRSSVLFDKQQVALGDLNGYIQERYTGLTEIKLYGKQEDSIEQFKEINNNLCENGFMAQFISGLMSPLISFITYIGIVAVCILGAAFAITGSITVGQLQAFIRYMWQLNEPLEQAAQLSASIQSAIAASGRVFEFLSETEEVAEASDPVKIENLKGNVTFEDVSFGYSKDKMLIEHLDLTVKSGQMVAIVGPTGAGKTTLINLLMRFYDINEGEIKVDGVNIQDMKRDDLRSIFGMVLQDTWLFNGTIADNIKYGKEDAVRQEIVNAATTANVNHFIKTQPDGYNMILNEESSNVSAGEKQLLTIARAFLADPAILILDEATSSVDTRLELMLQTAMKNIMKGRTSFVIAHRLSTIRSADLILVMKNGTIIEQGTHDELIARKGFYEKLYMSQFQNHA
ncbi:ABC transporter ATP-binding protein [Lacrimispora saccharolytica]|uniref:ABC transporter related protein n=1 Tax=Lacrimispora saccharolytica (strain ATCC 35040 / DSM 2544 / NRCC 2533 / WM1) TaxID=610130 RepID=D9R1Y7_LACSW|nr:ABC transporter ATP-binding protein [Lacrimispora saccharolytica]ADL02878.1 ABC transporter related protein [[Clostridium] saccharolyticum WM1]QRV18921.1 ABC transporter ATP-binding protein [Lacrimispora saccharolytica]